jgi:hypothetical protein
LGGEEVWNDWEGGRMGRILSPVMNVFLQLHIHCICYHLGDYYAERLFLSITVVLHVVEIHINVSIRCVPGGMCQTSRGCSLW